jgi:DNA-binding transcriptional MerR regulator
MEVSMTTTKLYSISEVADLFEKQNYHINYLLVTGKIPEPANRVAGKRLFDDGDIDRIREFFESKTRGEINEV